MPPTRTPKLFQCEHVTPGAPEPKTCGRSYRSKQALDQHVRGAHTGERPIDCWYCPETFAAEYQRTWHLHHAHQDKLYHCQVHLDHPSRCDYKGARMREFLLRHIEKCHEKNLQTDQMLTPDALETPTSNGSLQAPSGSPSTHARALPGGPSSLPTTPTPEKPPASPLSLLQTVGVEVAPRFSMPLGSTSTFTIPTNNASSPSGARIHDAADLQPTHTFSPRPALGLNLPPLPPQFSPQIDNSLAPFTRQVRQTNISLTSPPSRLHKTERSPPNTNSPRSFNGALQMVDSNLPPAYQPAGTEGFGGHGVPLYGPLPQEYIDRQHSTQPIPRFLAAAETEAQLSDDSPMLRAYNAPSRPQSQTPEHEWASVVSPQGSSDEPGSMDQYFSARARAFGVEMASLVAGEFETPSPPPAPPIDHQGPADGMTLDPFLSQVGATSTYHNLYN